jgi:PhnB protein
VSITLNPYLSFRGTARAAVEFYHSVFGGELTISTFAEFGASQDPSEDNQVMHSMLVAENGLTLMVSDTPSRMGLTVGDNISVSLAGSAEDDATLRGYWDKLSAGGTITQPLVTAQWGDAFGMCVDKFGITWLFNIGAAS